MIISRTGGENLATDVDITSPDRPVCIQRALTRSLLSKLMVKLSSATSVTCKVSSEMTKMIKVCLFTAI